MERQFPLKPKIDINYDTCNVLVLTIPPKKKKQLKKCTLGKGMIIVVR